MAQELPGSELPDNVLQALHAGRKIEAIKLLRGERGIDLKAAKQVIDAYVAEHPELVSRKATTEGLSFSSLLALIIFVVLVFGVYKLLFAS